MADDPPILNTAIQNPYQAPESPNTAWPVLTNEGLQKAIAFEGQVTQADIDSAYRNPGRFLISAILLVPGIALISISLMLKVNSFVNTGRFDFPLIFMLLLPILLALLGFQAWNRFGPGAGRKATKQNPYMLGPKRGLLDNEWFRIEGDNSQAHVRLAAGLQVSLKNRCLFLSFDNRGLVQIVLPEQLFVHGEMEQAFRFLKGFERVQPALTGIVDPRLLDEHKLLPIELSETAIPFSGCLLASDLQSKVGRTAIGKARQYLCLLAAIINLMLGFLAFVVPIGLIGIFALVANIFLYIVYRRSIGVLGNANQRLACFHGGLEENGIRSANAIQSNFSGWSVFESVYVTESLLVFAMRGKLAMFVSLHCRLFESDESWQKAQALVRRQCASLLVGNE